MDATYFLLLSSLGLVITTQAQDCTRPIGGDNMNLKDAYILLDTFPNGTKVSFACAVGYTPAGGSPSITCTAGSWSPVRLKCERRNCGAAEEVPNGHVDYSQGTEFGDELVVICNVGFRLVGRTNKRLCGAQGWLGRMPECEGVTCDPPPPVQSGTFRPDKEVYLYGDVVEYSCQQSYTLSGSRTISCSADGRFEPPPTCIMVHCEEPAIANADWVGGSRPPHGYQSTVTYQCKSGYTMIGESTLTCGVNSQWSPGLPTCQRLTTPKTTTTTTTTTTTKPLDAQCEEPVIANADWIGGSRPPHRYQSVVTYQCRSGYIMIGESTLTCGIDSQWSPGLPTCQLRGCEEPHIANAERTGGRPPYGYESLVTYQCKPGYKMIGEPTLTCERDGRWSPGLPTCQPDSDTTGNNGNSLALGLGIGLPLIIVVLVFCGWYFGGIPCIKTKRGMHRGPAGPVLLGLKNVD